MPAQEHPTIEVGEDRLLSADGPARPLSESQLSADPNNPKHLLAVVIQFDSPERNTCVAWASFDGGQRWTRRALPIQCFGDPWSVILSDGSAITVMLGRMDGHDDNAFLLRSPDGGRTWPGPPLGLGAHNDHPIVVAQGAQVYAASGGGIHNSANQHRDTVSVFHSQDGGKTFGPRTEVVASNLGYQAEGPLVLSDGTFVVGFHDYSRPSEKWLARPRSWLLRSSDQGRTFSEPLLISESCESRGGWPSMAADGKDRLFWLCIADKFDGVLVQRSDDRGESWSDPVRVNHSEKARSFTPSIAINKDGIIGVSWYEILDKNCFDVYFTASLDSGKSFLPEVRVSSVTSCPDTPQNKGVFEPGMTFGAGGDYSGLAATADGTFHVVWSDSRSGIYQLRTATVALKL
ncbi:MAG TPA: sialidase family protein [Candidatus Acidoferrum sp.]